jgi:hypothetical protein
MATLYAKRASDGSLLAVYTFDPVGGLEQLDETNAEVAAFLDAAEAARKAPRFLARDLFTQLTVADYTAIKTAVASSDALGLLWDSLKAQGDAAIETISPRFKQGWAGLSQALGTTRANAIAAVLGIPTT